jgi:sulfite reductase (NADPH) flavoprotein alpha-component
VYVQDKIKENGGELCKALVQGGASLFVCGDGAHMAKDVHAAFVEILVAHGGAASVDSAEAFMKELAASKRYLKDVWLA